MKNKKIRNHFSSIIEDILKFFWTIIIILVAVIFDYVKDISTTTVATKDVLLFVGGIVIFIIIVFIIAFIKWLKTTIEITEYSIIIDRNTILRKTSNINIKDISTVDISQNVIQKVFKTAKVQIDINSVVTAHQNDMKIILKYGDAVIFQKRILQLMNGDDLTDSQKIVLEQYDYSYSFSSIVRHTILSFNVLVLISILITYIPAIFYGDFTTETLLLGGLLVIGPMLYNAMKKFLSYYGFKIKKEFDKIDISYGYFTNKKFSMPYSKISGLKITQSLFARIFNLYSVELINIGYIEEDYVSLLLPLGTKQEITTRLNYLFPDIHIEFDEISRLNSSVIGHITNCVVWSIITTLIAFIIHYIAGLVMILIWIIYIVLSCYTKSLLYRDGILYITKGVYNKSIIICNTKDIQNISLKRNVINDKYNISRMTIVLRTNMVNARHTTGYFSNAIFDEVVNNYE